MRISLGSNCRRYAMTALILVMTLFLAACGRKAKQERELREFAISLMNEGAYGAAIAKFDEALSMHEGGVGEVEIDILKYRAQAEILLGDYEAAEYTYSLLEREDRKRPEYANLRVICIARIGKNLDKAMELYQKEEASDPYGTGHREALYVLGEALVESELASERETGRSLYLDAIADEKRRSGELYDRLGMLCFADGNIDDALEYFQQGLELIDSDEQYRDDTARRTITYNIAVCMEHKSRWQDALTMWKNYEKSYGSTEETAHEIAFLEGILAEAQ